MNKLFVSLFRKKIYLLVVTGLSVVLTLMLFLFPIREQRLALIDDKIVNDLYSLQGIIDDYVNEEGSLPKDIDDLDLDKELEKRAEEHDYSFESKGTREYELCADFKTDASKAYESDNPLESMSYSSYYYGSDDSPYSHKKGNDCFDFTSYSYNNPYQMDDMDPYYYNQDGSSSTDDSMYQYDDTMYDDSDTL